MGSIPVCLRFLRRYLPQASTLSLMLVMLSVLIAPVNTHWVKVLTVKGDVHTGSWITPSPTPTFTPSPTPKKGTSLEASKTAQGFAEYPGGKDTLEVEPSCPKPNYGVRGKICVKNTGDKPTQNLRILDQVQVKDKSGKFVALPGAALLITPDEPLKPGEQRCFSYQILFNPGTYKTFRNTAQVTITNHSGYLPGDPHCPGSGPCPFGPEPKADFNLPVIPERPVLQPSATPTSKAKTPPSPTPLPCSLAELEGGNGKAGSVAVQPGAAFSLTWKLVNKGTCTWDKRYLLQAAKGSTLPGLPTEIALPDSPVAPGKSAEVRLTASAPAKAGEYLLRYELVVVEKDGKRTPVKIEKADQDLLTVRALVGITPTATGRVILPPQNPAAPSPTATPAAPTATPAAPTATATPAKAEPTFTKTAPPEPSPTALPPAEPSPTGAPKVDLPAPTLAPSPTKAPPTATASPTKAPPTHTVPPPAPSATPTPKP